MPSSWKRHDDAFSENLAEVHRIFSLSVGRYVGVGATLGLFVGFYLGIDYVEQRGYERFIAVLIVATITGAIAGLNLHLSQTWGKGLVAHCLRSTLGPGCAAVLVGTGAYLADAFHASEIWQIGALGAGIGLFYACLIHVALRKRAG